MPPRNNNPEPPVMTRAQAMPIVAVALIFDLLRGFFALFWFFGPAAVGFYCTAKIGGVLTTYSLGLVSTKTAAALCATGAISGGSLISPVITPIGVVMADAIGLLGFLVIGFILLRTNSRMFRVNKSTWLLLAGSLGVAEIPFIGAFPMFSVALWVLYRRQIKLEKAAHQKWLRENANTRLQAQQQAQLMQANAAELAAADVY